MAARGFEPAPFGVEHELELAGRHADNATVLAELREHGIPAAGA